MRIPVAARPVLIALAFGALATGRPSTASGIAPLPTRDQHEPAAAPLIGLDPGAKLPEIHPKQITGPGAGNMISPLALAGARPGVAIWTRPAGLSDVPAITRALDDALAAIGSGSATGFVVLVPDPRMSAEQAESTLKAAFGPMLPRRVLLTIADPNEDAVKASKLSTDDGATCALVEFVNRKVVRVVANPKAGTPDVRNLATRLRQLASEEEPFAETAVRMCADQEPGEPMEFFGRVLDEQGLPLPKAAVIAYNTDATGLYVPTGSSTRTPRIRGVAVTDDNGWYRFRTIRPAGYPNTDDPQHIHMHADAAVHAQRYVTVWFDDDPRLTPEKRTKLDAETVIVTPRKRDGVWIFRQDIRLRGS